jgi:hypothetical protein
LRRVPSGASFDAMAATEIDKLVCRSIVIVDSQGRERITIGVGTGDGCAVIEVKDGLPADDDGTPTSVSLTAERGSADVYVSNGARAMRLDLDGLECKTFGDDVGFPNDDPTLSDLERRVIALMLDCVRLLKRLPASDAESA